MILSCIAIDDEILALNKIKRFISKLDFIELKHCFDNAHDAIEYLQKNKIDLLFLDVEMPEMSGFQFLNTLKEKPHVILTTAFDQYALKSYDFEVTDYLLKPIQIDRFIKAVEKVYSQTKIEKSLESLTKHELLEDDHFFIKSSGNIVKIYFNDILFIEGMKDYLSIHTAEKRTLTLMSFNQIMSKLPKNNFIRVHKSFAVALNKIDQFNSNEIIIDSRTIPISRTYKKNLQNLTKSL